MVYSTVATGRLYPPHDSENNVPDIEKAKAQLEAIQYDDPIVSDTSAKVEVDEFYYSDGNLQLTVPMGEWHVSLSIPLRPSDKFKEVLSQINRDFDSVVKESGYWLHNDDLAFVDSFETDGQGRVTLGKEYADQKIRLAGER